MSLAGPTDAIGLGAGVIRSRPACAASFWQRVVLATTNELLTIGGCVKDDSRRICRNTGTHVLDA
jgi:hypothetical protein